MQKMEILFCRRTQHELTEWQREIDNSGPIFWNKWAITNR